MTVFFYGDPHGRWDPLLNAAPEFTPADLIVILGDCELDEPLRVKIAPVMKTGARVRWIIGNHDVDSEAEYDFLGGDFPDGDLHTRVEMHGSIAVGGLGGTFKGRIWHPKLGDEKPLYLSRAEYVRSLRHFQRWRKGVPFPQRAAIWQEDFELLAKRRLDVVVTHEAPSTHKHGFAGLDQLAARTRARWLIHGHHHRSYDAELPGGCRVRGLAKAELWELPE
jgi:predicted phosphodiesterase